MIRKNTVFDFLESVFVIFGITVLSLCVFVTMFGNEAKEISDIFSLGNDGVSIATLIQFFGMSFLVCAIRFICFTNLIIKTEVLHKYSMMKLIIAMKSNFGQEGLIKVGLYCIGELIDVIIGVSVKTDIEEYNINEEEIKNIIEEIRKRKISNEFVMK